MFLGHENGFLFTILNYFGDYTIDRERICS